METSPLDRLDDRAAQRVKGRSWEGLRAQFIELSKLLLEVSPSVRSELTTIYVKFLSESDDSRRPFAVVWLKTSRQMTLGLALPETVASPLLSHAPAGMKYAGLTGYVTVKSGESLPNGLEELIKAAFDSCSQP